jgi:hypothetical protein|tara:strand:+ start:244 stop:435 length:192 start_codon:yes stop_codon:yes gene_type:complete
LKYRSDILDIRALAALPEFFYIIIAILPMLQNSSKDHQSNAQWFEERIVNSPSSVILVINLKY